MVPLAPQSAFDPLGQQSPNMAGRELFLAMGFAQSRLQQLMSVEHCWPLGLQPPARASVPTRNMVLATAARRAVRQNDFASDIVSSSSGRGECCITRSDVKENRDAGKLVGWNAAMHVRGQPDCRSALPSNDGAFS